MIGALAALVVVTCAHEDGSVAVQRTEGVGLLALDLAPAAADLRDAERLPTTVTILIDSDIAGTVLLPAPDGLLAGHATIPLASSAPVELSLIARYADGSTAHSAPVDVHVESDQVITLPLLRASAGRLILGQQRRAALPVGTNLAVYFKDALRETALMERIPRAPAASIGAVLRDPQVGAVVPFADLPSPADEVGALVAISVAAPATPAIELTPAPAASAPVVEAAVVEVAPAAESEPAIEPPTGSAAPTRPADFIYYYSYCSCGKPVVDRAYTATLADGSTRTGHTDRFGLVLLPDVGDVDGIDFGAGQRDRERSYSFDAKNPDDSAPALFAALVSEIANDRLTALLDLRRAPLADARDVLVALLDHDAEWTRVNAAVTLSYYTDLDELVSTRLARLARGADLARELVILGALRHPAARQPIRDLVAGGTLTVEQSAVAAWALGFLAQDAPATATEPLEFIYFQF